MNKLLYDITLFQIEEIKQMVNDLIEEVKEYNKKVEDIKVIVKTDAEVYTKS